MTLRLVVCAAVAAVLVAAAPAAAKPPSSAVRFADAGLRAERSVMALAPQYERRAAELQRACESVLFAVGDDVPARARERALAIAVSTLFSEMTVPALPAIRRMVADLEQIPTQDPVLRSGRAAWRASLDFSLRFPVITDGCDALTRWQDAGWSRAQTPAFDLTAYRRMMRRIETDTSSRKLTRAVRRLRVLGVSRRRARAFEGNALLDAAEPLIDALVLAGLEDEF